MTQSILSYWLLLALAAFAGFLVGRWTAPSRPRETPAERATREATEALSLEQQVRRLDGPIGSEVRALIAEGRDIEAIKRVRGHLGLGLKEAKGLVDHIRGRTRTRAAP